MEMHISIVQTTTLNDTFRARVFVLDSGDGTLPTSLCLSDEAMHHTTANATNKAIV